MVFLSYESLDKQKKSGEINNEIFNYTQTVNALYLSSNINLPNDYSLKAGTRYEHTNIEGDWKNGVQSAERNNLIKVMKKWNGKVIDIPYTKGISSTHLKKKFRKGK